MHTLKNYTDLQIKCPGKITGTLSVNSYKRHHLTGNLDTYFNSNNYILIMSDTCLCLCDCLCMSPFNHTSLSLL